MQKWIYFLLIVLSFVLYGNSIQNDYSLDDEYITDVSYIKEGIKGIPNIITHRYGKKGDAALDYRPVVLASYALEYQFFERAPHVSHLVNILLYALCLIVLYNVLISVFSLHKINEWLPLCITILYAIHPLHTEVVDSLKNRDELFTFLFGLLFLKYGYAYFTQTEKRLQLALLAVVFLGLTLVSKLIGILYLPIFILILLFYRLLKWNSWNYLLLGLLVVILSLVLKIVLTGMNREIYSFENSLIDVSDIGVVFATSLKITLFHIKMLLLPFPLRYYYGYNLFPLQSNFEPVVIFSFFLHIALLGIGIFKFWKKDILGFFILCYFASMALYSNFPIPYTGMFSERALFLSSLWFIAALILVVFRLLNKYKINFVKYTVYTIAFIVFTFHCYQTIYRNFFWKNKYILVTHDMPYLKNSVAANYLYANLLIQKTKEITDSTEIINLARKAAISYQKNINLYPYYGDFFYQLAMVNRYYLKDLNAAEKIFKNMLVIDSMHTAANYELGKLYYDKRELKQSYPYFKRAYKNDTLDFLILLYLPQSALAAGDIVTCYEVNKAFLKRFPTYSYPYANLGVYYSTILKDDSAVYYFGKSVALGDRNPEVLKNMVIYFNKKQNSEKANYYQNLLQKK